MRRHVLARWIVAAALAPLTVACAGRPEAKAPAASVANSAPKTAATSEPPAERNTELETGEVAPIEHAEPIAARLVGRYAEGDFETLALEVVLPLPAAFNGLQSAGTVVALDGEAAAPYAFAALPDDVAVIEGRGVGAALLWVRRSAAAATAPLSGHLYTPQRGPEPGHHVRFQAVPSPAPKNDRKVRTRWAEALALHLKGMSDGPWHRFAVERIREVFGDQAGAKNAPMRAPLRDTLASLMETTTGMFALQEALQQDRPLIVLANKEKRAVPISKLRAPASTVFPWDDMLGRVGKSAASEPLAGAVPAEFWYLRASDVTTVFQLADELDRFGTPAARVADGAALDRALLERYATELGLTRAGFERALGREVVDRVALVGSDPYLREGTDLTALFRVKQPALFEAFLEATLATVEKTHGPLVREGRTHEGTALGIARSADGAVHQWRAQSGDLFLLSNSQASLKRVLDASAGRVPRLSESKDFRYMLARDATPAQGAFAFMGDSFVSEVVGPRQKVLEARRQLALAELMTPGFAALLYGFVYGRSPATVDELVASRLLRASELAHANGSAITWRPGTAARSSWGTPSALTPLIDLPPADRVTESERAAYERFARSYETYWSSYIDPAALRVVPARPKPAPAPGAPWGLTADLRVLPLIEGSDYNDIRELAGEARVSVPRLTANGLRAVVGIGPSAGVRRELGQLAGGLGGRHRLTIDFLGDWAMAGIADRARLTAIVKNVGAELPQLPQRERARVDEVQQIARAPLYAAVAIRSASGAALALSALRLTAKDALGGMIGWGEVASEADVSVVRVTVRPQRGTPEEAQADVAIYYALMSDVLLIALDESILRGLVHEVVEGRGPKPATVQDAGAQLVVDLAAAPEGGLLTVVSWLLTQEMMSNAEPSRALAGTLLRGAPERATSATEMHALALAYFGGVPLPPNGGVYTLTRGGVSDPANGSLHAPRWPRLPVAGSPVEALLRGLGAFRAEVQLDDEGRDPQRGRAMQSLHVTSTLGTRP